MCPLLNASCTARANRRAPATPASAARSGPPAHGHRGAHEAQQADQQHVHTAGDLAQREVRPAPSPIDVGLDLGARHQVLARGRGRVDVLQRRRCGPDDGDLSAQTSRPAPCRRRPVRRGPSRPCAAARRSRPRWSRPPRRSSSRPILRPLNAPPRARPSSSARGRRGASAGSRRPGRSGRRRWRPPRRTPRARRRRRARSCDPSVATSSVPSSTFFARPTDSISALSSLRVLAGLGELDVVGDDLRAGVAEAVDHARVEAARERPALAGAR